MIFAVAAMLLAMMACDMCYATVDPSVTIKFTNKSQFLIFTFTTFALAIVSLFYHKKGILQMRICIINAILLFAYQIWIVWEFFKLKAAYSFTIVSIFPIVAMILLIISIRYILRDEAAAMFAGSPVVNKKIKAVKKSD
ncbi:MAG: DUF4293 family protein [Bacteroidales bacterium]|nr:DUF4293 family protein [Bacteroidales bacterium]MDD3201074.1 DUF4293 family protein [Bacteroidales bacterium]